MISTYNRQGVEEIETPGRGGRRHEYLSVEEEKEFLAPFFAHAESGEIATALQVKLAFEARVGHEVEESTIYRLLDRHGWRKLMPRPSTQREAKKSRNSLKNFAAQVQAAVATRQADDERPVLVMTQDEGRFGRISRPKRCWVPPSIRSSVPSQIVRESMYVFAAFAPSLGQLVSLVLPTANTAMMNLFLEHLSQVLASYFIVMQVDQAGWHRSAELVVPANIRLIQQPAYSRSA